jgi:multiple antibiotic resistance protein
MKTVGIAFLETFGVLFPIVDPIGNVPTFMALTSGWDTERTQRLIARVVWFVIVVLSLFALTGEPLLHFFGISLEALQIAGGIVIAFTGFKMITGTEESIRAAARGGDDAAFSPLTVPLLAGPGAMAAILALESREEDVLLSIPGTIAGIVAIGACVYLAFRFGERLSRWLGRGGLAALTTIMGLIVLAIGAELIVHGIVEHGAVVEID